MVYQWEPGPGKRRARVSKLVHDNPVRVVIGLNLLHRLVHARIKRLAHHFQRLDAKPFQAAVETVVDEVETFHESFRVQRALQGLASPVQVIESGKERFDPFLGTDRRKLLTLTIQAPAIILEIRRHALIKVLILISLGLGFSQLLLQIGTVSAGSTSLRGGSLVASPNSSGTTSSPAYMAR